MRAGAPIIVLKEAGNSNNMNSSSPSICYCALTEDMQAVVWSAKALGLSTNNEDESIDEDEVAEMNRFLIREIADIQAWPQQEKEEEEEEENEESWKLRITFFREAPPLSLIFATKDDFSAWYEGLLFVCESSNRKEAQEASELAEAIRLENIHIRKLLEEKSSSAAVYSFCVV